MKSTDFRARVNSLVETGGISHAEATRRVKAGRAEHLRGTPRGRLTLWKEAIAGFPLVPSDNVGALHEASRLLGEATTHAFLPGGGGLDFHYLGPKHGVHQLHLKGHLGPTERPLRYVARVASVRRLNDRPDYRSGVLITLAPWDVKADDDGRTDLVRWVDGRWAEVDEPDDDTWSRLRGGAVLVVAKGSVYNAISGTYDGRHAFLGPDELSEYLTLHEDLADAVVKVVGKEDPDMAIIRSIVARRLGDAEAAAGIHRPPGEPRMDRARALVCLDLARSFARSLLG